MFRRRTNRLNSHIYEGNYWYFVTICTQEKSKIFGSVVNGEMVLNKIGNVIQSKITQLPNIYNIHVDQFIVMPNHVHLMIGNNTISLSRIIAGFESFATKEVKQLVAESSRFPCGDREAYATALLLNNHNTLWQKSFYDHVIRSDRDLSRVREYINNNPLQWELDEYFT